MSCSLLWGDGYHLGFPSVEHNMEPSDEEERKSRRGCRHEYGSLVSNRFYTKEDM